MGSGQLGSVGGGRKDGRYQADCLGRNSVVRTLLSFFYPTFISSFSAKIASVFL